MFQIRVLINQIHERQVDVKADLHTLRLASLNQILDPWIYILFRRELFVRVFKCLEINVFSRCCFGVSSHVRCAPANRTRHVSFLKNESDYVHINDEKDHINHQNGQKCIDGENVDANMYHVTVPSASIRRQHSKTSGDGKKSSGNNKSPSLQATGNNLCMKHSACLFCLSNHPKKVVLSSITESRSMDNFQVIVDSNTTCKEHNFFNDSNALRKDSIHLSLSDLCTFRDGHLAGNSNEDVGVGSANIVN